MRARSAPFFSLVVPTIDREVELACLFDSLTASTSQDFEVIVVDQNHDDRAARVVRAYSQSLPIAHYQVAFRGAARARNYGAARTNGRFINFPDDDCELSQTLLADARELLLRRHLQVLVGMAVDRSGGASTTRFVIDDRYLTLRTMWGRNIEFTMFFDGRIFRAVGGYDERFGVGSDYGAEEGAELLIRMISALDRNSIFYSHTLRFYHPDKAADISAAALARAFHYSRGRGALLAKWSLPQVYAASANYLLRSLMAWLVFRGMKRRIYSKRIRGFFNGYRSYRRDASPRRAAPSWN